MRDQRYEIVTVHGEGRTLWQIVDTFADDDEQPAVVQSLNSAEHTYAAAVRRCALWEAGRYIPYPCQDVFAKNWEDG